jgi:hypothetical protein
VRSAADGLSTIKKEKPRKEEASNAEDASRLILMYINPLRPWISGGIVGVFGKEWWAIQDLNL